MRKWGVYIYQEGGDARMKSGRRAASEVAVVGAVEQRGHLIEFSQVRAPWTGL
jgi:hypothetical protein